MNLFYRPESVQNFFGDGREFGIDLHYSLETEILGTAGGVKRLERWFDGPFVVVYGDVLTDLDLDNLVRFHEERGTEPHVTLSLYHAPNPWECGIVDLDEAGRVTEFVEKPPRDAVGSDLANSGVFVFDTALLSYVPETGFCDFGNDVFPLLLRDGVAIYGLPLPEGDYLIDIGTPEKFERAQHEWPTSAFGRTK